MRAIHSPVHAPVLGAVLALAAAPAWGCSGNVTEVDQATMDASSDKSMGGSGGTIGAIESGNGGATDSGTGGAIEASDGPAGTGGSAPDAEAGFCLPGSAGAGAWSGWPSDTLPVACPESKAGPALVPVRGGYCIDATEVTRGQYAAWLASNPSVASQPAVCAWNTDFVPGDTSDAGPPPWPPAQGEELLPVVGVDWCDARAFCEAAGKRLCGDIQGGPTDPRDTADPRDDAWDNACEALPFGDNGFASQAPDPQNCTLLCGTSQSLSPVGSKPACASTAPGYAAIYDLLGNAGEWEDSCSKQVGQADRCNLRGVAEMGASSCTASCTNRGPDDKYALVSDPDTHVLRRGDQNPKVGFRCCADVHPPVDPACEQPVWGAETVPASCPTSLGGPKLVPIRGGYCIDETEVTREQYVAWLATAPTGKNPLCNKEGFAPENYSQGCSSQNWPPANNEGQLPVVCVDWCDAYAYCEAVGKRLCGRIGSKGSSVDQQGATANWLNASDPTRDQWYNACSSGGVNRLSYGNEVQASCNTRNVNLWHTTPVGSMTGCQSPLAGYAGVYDLTGNVEEWTDDCDLLKPSCPVRGGNYGLYAFESGCDATIQTAASAVADWLGFRCCSP